MRNATRSVVLAALSTVGGLASIASAAPNVDGTLDAGLYTRFATQTVGTQFGDNQSELDAGYYRVDSGKLYLFLAGNLESNNNHLALFFDTRAGGQNAIRPDNPNIDFNGLNKSYGGLDETTGTSAHGFTFDSAFAPDYFLDVNRSGGAVDSQMYANFSELNTNGGGTGGYLGSITVPANGAASTQIGSGTVGGTGGLPSVTIGYNDSNIGGVDGTTNAADATAANAVTTGSEFSIDLASLGITGDFKIAALINGGGSGYLSNQALGGFAAGTGNLGGDGTGVYNGTVSALDLNNFAGDQFATISVSLTSYTYNVDADSNYSSPTAFTPPGIVPTGGDGRVLFGSKITANRTVTIDQDISLSSLTFDNTHTYTLAGTHSITIAGNSATNAVSVLSGSHVISAPVVFGADTRINTAVAGSSLSLTGTVNAAGRNLFKVGAGTLAMPATAANSFTVSAGTLRLTGSGNSVVKGVTVDTTTSPGTAIDLTNSALIVDYDDGFSPLAAIKATIAAGGIVSSTRSASKYAVGYVDSAAVPSLVAYNGAPLDATAIVFRVTLKGDTNLDQAVNFNDLVTLAQNYNGTAKEWYQGDFTRDGKVDFSDLVSLAQNYNGTVSPLTVTADFGASFASDWALAQSVAPEPTSLAAMALLGGMLARRRK